MQPVNFEEVIEKILEKDSRYHRDAYFFVREALDHTQKVVAKSHKDQVRHHVSGMELLNGIKDYGLIQFGPMAMTVLAEWGITRSEDFGEMVFSMIDHSLLAKTDKDTREDFKSIYDFEEVFTKPFLPTKKPKSRNSQGMPKS
ncbi:MAG: hypothetical protein JWN25_854 [Verrucomicrobiales bacterium]|jgi:uncharacterized repeat protein (TIGR04138 family)|nr:hypothetical protein [Verrucomicrobiales bacterium]MDB6130556.1 hypothetical protein [Verrucomicrobiales bacterium]